MATRSPEKLAHVTDHEVVQLELGNPESCTAACDGIDVVVHMGGTPSPKSPFHPTILDSNIKGTYNILWAAKEAGCSRVVLGSSIQAVAGYPMDRQVHTDSPVRPLNMYGVSKCFMEAAAHYFAIAEGLSCIAVRIGNYAGNYRKRGLPRLSARNLSAFVSERDLCEMLVRCVEVKDVPFAIVHAVSDNRFKWLDMTDTTELLGWRPADDAFRIQEVDLLYTDQWIRRDPPTWRLSTDLSQESSERR
jgi:uronate dehydrogenase